MSNSLREQWKAFTNDEPGCRFENRFEKTEKEGGGRGVRIALLVAGALLVLGGLLLMPLPGPGIPVVALGAAMVAQGSRKLSKGLDWCELSARAVAKSTRRAWKTCPAPQKGAYTFLAFAFLCGIAFLTYRLTIGA